MSAFDITVKIPLVCMYVQCYNRHLSKLWMAHFNIHCPLHVGYSYGIPNTSNLRHYIKHSSFIFICKQENRFAKWDTCVMIKDGKRTKQQIPRRGKLSKNFIRTMWICRGKAGECFNCCFSNNYGLFLYCSQERQHYYRHRDLAIRCRRTTCPLS